MWFKKKNPNPAKPRENAALIQSAASFLARDLTIVGTVMSIGEVTIEGRVEGRACGARLTIGETGFVQGDVIASEAIIHGHVAGGLRAKKVQIRAHGSMEGNIIYRTLSVDAGGLLNADCWYSDTPIQSAGEHIKEQPVLSPQSPMTSQVFRSLRS